MWNHAAWKDIEMPSFKTNGRGRKKSNTLETTSGSTKGGLDLHNVDDSEDEETRESRPLALDASKKKSSASSREPPA